MVTITETEGVWLLHHIASIFQRETKAGQHSPLEG